MDFYYTKQTKRGKWRLYRVSQTAVTAWRGSNDKTTVVRLEDGTILEHDTRETIVAFCKERYGCSPFENAD